MSSTRIHNDHVSAVFSAQYFVITKYFNMQEARRAAMIDEILRDIRRDLERQTAECLEAHGPPDVDSALRCQCRIDIQWEVGCARCKPIPDFDIPLDLTSRPGVPQIAAAGIFSSSSIKASMPASMPEPMLEPDDVAETQLPEPMLEHAEPPDLKKHADMPHVQTPPKRLSHNELSPSAEGQPHEFQSPIGNVASRIHASGYLSTKYP